MPRTYLPLTDGGLLNWSANFLVGIADDPLPFGLTAAEVTTYDGLQSAYAAAYNKAIDPATRGTATVLAKNTAKKPLVAESRRLGMAVTAHPGVTDQQRHDLGLTVKDVEPTPVPPPSTSPVLQIVSTTGRKIKIKLKDFEGSSRAKPEGVLGATVMSAVGTTPPATEADWKFEGNTTKTTIDVTFAADLPAGSQVWLTAFWFNRKTQSGPAANPITTRLPGTLGQAA